MGKRPERREKKVEARVRKMKNSLKHTLNMKGWACGEIHCFSRNRECQNVDRGCSRVFQEAPPSTQTGEASPRKQASSQAHPRNPIVLTYSTKMVDGNFNRTWKPLKEIVRAGSMAV